MAPQPSAPQRARSFAVAIAWIDPNRGRQVLAIGQAETAHERTATGARQ